MGVWRLPFSLATALHHLAEFMFSGKVTNCVFLVTRPRVQSPVLTSSFPGPDTKGRRHRRCLNWNLT